MLVDKINDYMLFVIGVRHIPDTDQSDKPKHYPLHVQENQTYYL